MGLPPSTKQLPLETMNFKALALTGLVAAAGLGTLVTATPAKADGYKVTTNAHGALVKYAGGEVLALGRSCDATFDFNGTRLYGTWNCNPGNPVARVGGRTITLAPIWGMPVDRQPSYEAPRPQYHGGYNNHFDGRRQTIIIN